MVLTMANFASVLFLTTLVATQVHVNRAGHIAQARFFFSVNKTLVNNIIPTVTQTVYPLRTCVVVPADVTSTCSYSTTEALPPTTLAVQPTPVTPVPSVTPTSTGPLFSANVNVKNPVLFVTLEPTASLSASVSKSVMLADNVHPRARHLRLPTEPSQVESVQVTEVPEIEDISFRASDPEIQSSQQDFAEVEIHGLPDSCFEHRDFLQNPITIWSVDRTGTPVTTTIIASSNTVNRVSLTIGGCLPNPPLAYDRC